MVKIILALVDGSDFIERNVNYACDLAKNTGSRLTLVHVATLPTPIQAWSPALTSELPLDTGRLRKPMEDAGLSVLEKAKDIAKKNNLDVDTMLQTAFGNPAQEIIKVAEQQKSDLS